MARVVPEWIAKNDDQAIPDRVKLRILARQKDCCAGCGKAFTALRKPEFDHRPALTNGGQNRESMIEAVCFLCHLPRTKADVAEKSRVNSIKAKHLGIRGPKRKIQSQGFRRTKSNTKYVNEDLA